MLILIVAIMCLSVAAALSLTQDGKYLMAIFVIGANTHIAIQLNDYNDERHENVAKNYFSAQKSLVLLRQCERNADALPRGSYERHVVKLDCEQHFAQFKQSTH